MSAKDLSSRYMIQSYVPRQQSVAVKISNSGDRFGLDSFFTENIPFDSVTSRVVAAQLVDTIVFLVERIPKNAEEKLHIYEFGAGLGILAGNVLDIMRNFHTSLYDRVVLHISDISASKLHELERLPAFVEHRDHVIFQVCDLITPVFSPGEEPLLVYHSYLMAALPVRHIIMVEGAPYEALIKTTVPADLELIDTELEVPRRLGAIDIRKRCEQPTASLSPLLMRRLCPFIREEVKMIPVSESDMSADEKDFLREWLAYTQPREMKFFNFHYLAAVSTLNLARALPPGAGYVVIDIGEEKLIQEGLCIDLLSRYGLYTYYPFSFQLLEFCAKKSGLDYNVQNEFSYSNGNVVGFLSNTRDNGDYVYHFDKVFRKSNPGFYDKMRGKFEAVNSNEAFDTFCCAWPELQKSYLLWLGFARTMLCKKLYDAAITCLENALRDSQGLSLTAKTLLAQTYEHKQEPSRAIALYEDIYRHSPYHEPTLRALCRHYLGEREYDKMIGVLKAWIRSTRENTVDRQVLMLMRALKQTGDTEELNKWLGWL
ncbi:hypothetical protein FKG94_22630 [Exilibacterium tricleocarpae]|uniref:Tetratricopeptide repeat protein n=1 Tax=Exilibacterium tricleocarpae TaxID=2591008 RepID=A0A545SYB8_9GAMM|nr:SAM-dependent methyltransferase [Exilibacterium tricleocarpae]TQV69951.1 hypothetical protein FKG94_22630 [Exilibacterium tricleocarpae]